MSCSCSGALLHGRPRTRSDWLIADKDCSSRTNRRLLRRRRIKATIPKRATSANRRARGGRGDPTGSTLSCTRPETSSTLLQPVQAVAGSCHPLPTSEPPRVGSRKRSAGGPAIAAAPSERVEGRLSRPRDPQPQNPHVGRSRVPAGLSGLVRVEHDHTTTSTTRRNVRVYRPAVPNPHSREKSDTLVLSGGARVSRKARPRR